MMWTALASCRDIEKRIGPAEAMEEASAVLLLLLLLRWALASDTYRDIDALTSSSTGLTGNVEHAYTHSSAQTTTHQIRSEDGSYQPRCIPKTRRDEIPQTDLDAISRCE